MDPVSIPEAVETIEEPWSPRIVANANDQHVKVARLDGEFVWHAHPDADELFSVLDGRLKIEFRDDPAATLTDGDLLVVPAGVEHRPIAPEETTVILFEPAGTRNTGDAEDSEFTLDDPEEL
ncbi:MAG: mannose-6-phosphate isomerase-like protein (cupin superfamily) [Halobacteriales archaeon]|jgi:mannose-6-phosphate isomerase-like protein (cupin superfamily)